MCRAHPRRRAVGKTAGPHRRHDRPAAARQRRRSFRNDATRVADCWPRPEENLQPGVCASPGARPPRFALLENSPAKKIVDLATRAQAPWSCRTTGDKNPSAHASQRSPGKRFDTGKRAVRPDLVPLPTATAWGLSVWHPRCFPSEWVLGSPQRVRRSHANGLQAPESRQRKRSTWKCRLKRWTTSRSRRSLPYVSPRVGPRCRPIDPPVIARILQDIRRAWRRSVDRRGLLRIKYRCRVSGQGSSAPWS